MELEQEPTLNDVQTMTEYTLPVAKLSKRFDQLLNLSLECVPIMSGTPGWWVKKQRGHFKKYGDKNKKRMGEDFEAYKRSPWIHLVPFLRDLMIFKWINTCKEKEVASAWWLKQWGPKDIHTRVELNDSNLLRGGLTAHNNKVQCITCYLEWQMFRVLQGMERSWL